LMPPTEARCPVQGCGRWSHRWKHHGYSLPATSVFTLQLDASIDTRRNNRICGECYKRHFDHTVSLDGRTRVVPSQPSASASAASDGVSTLISAALHHDSVSSASPPLSFSPADSSSSFTASSPLPRSSSSSSSLPALSLPPPLPPPQPPPLCTALSDITNSLQPPQRSPSRRLSTTLKRKREAVRAVSDATTAAERAGAMARCGIDHSALSDYRRVVAEHDSRDKQEREPLTARRLSGGRATSRKPQRTTSTDGWLPRCIASLLSMCRGHGSIPCWAGSSLCSCCSSLCLIASSRT
jgi:hypothetical protein